MSNKAGTVVGAFRVCKRNKELFKGFPYFVAIDLPQYPEAWYLRADGTINVDCCDNPQKRDENSGWFASMEDVNTAIKLYEENGAKQAC